HLDGEIGAAAAYEGTHPGDELPEGERLRQVVVAAGAEAREAVRQRVAGREEHHRCVDTLRPERLADVPPVRVGQANVEDEDVRHGLGDAAEQVRAGGEALRLEALLAQAPDEDSAQLVVVLGDEDAGLDHSSLSIAPSGSLLTARAASSPARAVPARAAPARPPRKLQGTARWSGGGSKTCWSMATSISLSSQPSMAASARPESRTRAASLQMKA